MPPVSERGRSAPAEPVSPREPGRTPELDGIRGVAILLVLSWHYAIAQLPLPTATWQIAGYCMLGIGWSGVDLFFVLSGFLIGGILLDNRRAPNVLRVFYVRRALRILPIYALVVGAAYIVITFTNYERAGLGWAFGGHQRFWPYLTMTQNFLSRHSMFLGPTWSLAIEEQFYLLLPALVVLLRPRALVRVSWMMIALSVIARFFMSELTEYSWTFGRLDGLFIGVLLAHGARNPAVLAWTRANLGTVKLTSGLLFLGTLEVAINRVRFGAVAFTWVALFYASILVVALADRDSWLARLMRQRWLRWTGQIAYGLYLFHQPIYILCQSWLADRPQAGTLAHRFALSGVAFLVLMAFASLCYRYFELPLINVGKRFKYAPPVPAP